MRTTITPGRLYAKLASEFRQCCCGNCSSCVVPMPFPLEGTGPGPNWALEALPRDCEKCAKLIQDLVRRYQAEYDLLDPFSRPMRPHGPRPSGGHLRAH
jgi:hypothetical protein